MGALKDLFSSERGFFALVLVIAATVLTGLHDMTIDQWQSFATWVFGIYVGGKTITSAVGLFTTPAAIAANAKYSPAIVAITPSETPKVVA
jgi:hypothetical protein